MCLKQIIFLWYLLPFFFPINFDDLISVWEFYIFLNALQGDFVDRGYNSLEVFTILLLLKARYVLLMHACVASVLILDLLALHVLLIRLSLGICPSFGGI